MEIRGVTVVILDDRGYQMGAATDCSPHRENYMTQEMDTRDAAWRDAIESLCLADAVANAIIASDAKCNEIREELIEKSGWTENAIRHGDV